MRLEREPATVRGVSVSLQRSAFVVTCLAVVLSSSPARADDARALAARVEAEWTKSGAEAVTLASRFVFDDETVRIALPTPPRVAPCTQVAIVAARGTSFRARFEDASEDPLHPEPEARGNGVAGVLELRRCDPARPVVALHVTSDAGRGSIEIVVATSEKPMPSLSVVLPERTGGPLPRAPDAGPLSPLPTPEKRAEAAEARARREGAVATERLHARAGEDGLGTEPVLLQPGCHRIEVFGQDPRTERPGRRFRLDVDAELRDADGERLFARDRTEAPDAKLDACVGDASSAQLVFAGAVPATEVTVAHAMWPLPAQLPPLWGPETRGRMARAMFARHVAVPESDAVFLAQGSSGRTPFPVQVEVGGCYLAVAAVSHGQARTFSLRALVGPRESTDERGAADGAALVAFCVRAGERARLEVHARGQSIGYGLALYRVKSGAWEVGR